MTLKSLCAMNSFEKRMAIILLILFVDCLPSAFSASNVTISPKNFNATTGTWLTVEADVNSGADVSVYVVVDFNTNGVKDGMDQIIRCYKIREGTPPMVAGSPCPGDEDPADGHLLSRLDFWQTPQISGNYLIIVNDGAGEASDTFQIEQSATSQSVSGTVLDEHGAPVVGWVRAEDRDSGLEEWATWTKPDGTFTLYLPSSYFKINAWALGYLRDASAGGQQGIFLAPDTPTSGVTLTLLSGDYTISGLLVDSTTSSGIPYLWTRANFEDDLHDYELYSLSDSNGYYHLPVVNGSWEIEVDRDSMISRGIMGNYSHIYDIAVTDADTNDINLYFSHATTYITGFVTREKDGAPLSGFEMRADDQDMEVGTYTRSDGSYVLLVTPGSWEVGVDDEYADQHGFLKLSSQNTNPTTETPTTGINFQLEEPTAFIEVYVREKGTTQPLAFVEVVAIDANWQYYNGHDTNSRGYCIFGVTPGLYRITCETGDNFAPLGFLTVVASAGSTQTVILEPEKANAYIHGIVTHEGQAESSLDMILENDNGHVASTETDSDGYYRFPILAGIYYVRPNGDWLVERNIAPVARRQVAVSAGTTATLDWDVSAPTAWLDVQVLGEGNAPLEGMDVWIDTIIGSNQEEYLITLSTDAQGSFVLGVTSGSYTIGIASENLIAAGYMPADNQIINMVPLRN
ncbi:MAG: carboxypeptidase-like regulatory domain-containing protein [Candidatus Sumerlaeota bacterium]|nr:carboxypeptidase-like regulatory domain-containing protein [Candidatus Sumerlaeota bacterium]